jgi:LysR family transcriptional regulator, glycine cleavage system transcriptional activator
MDQRRLPPLPALRAFEAAARHLSFKRAADELSVTPTAISHHIRLLEGTLGVRLFDRRHRQVVMTAEAQALYPVLRDGLDNFAAAIAGIARKQRRPAVTLSATTAFTARWLIPRMGAFRSAHPNVDMNVLATDDPVDLGTGAVDLAIRYGRAPFPGLTSELLIVDRFAPVASPRLGVARLNDLKHTTLLHFDWRHSDASTPTWLRWLTAARVRGIDAQAGMRFSDESHAIQSAIAGHGIALLSLTLVADELASGALVVPFGPQLRGHSYHLVYKGSRPADTPAAAVRSWLLSEIRSFRTKQ